MRIFVLLICFGAAVGVVDPQGYSNCRSDEYRCNNGFCIHERYKCDGQRQCPNGEDELQCYVNQPCRFDEFACDGRCVQSSWRCDGRHHCIDLSDEQNCPNTANKRCTSNEFTCSNGNCIPQNLKCDSYYDCSDRSDELNCPSKTTTPRPALSPSPRCESNEFTCGNGKCIPLNFKCDSFNDCSDRSDELNCPSPTTISRQTVSPTPKCGSNKVACLDVCIPLSFRCDSVKDCPDGSDELNCPSQRSTPRPAFNPTWIDNSNRGSLSITQFNDVYNLARDQDLSISCDSDGYINRDVTVRWSKVNEHSLGSNVRQVGHALSIDNALSTNAGTYECNIEWNGQRASSRLNIVVM